MASPTQWIWVWARSRDGEGQESLACCSPRGHKQTRLSNWITTTNTEAAHISIDGLKGWMCSADRLQLKRTNSLTNVWQRCPHADLSNIKGIQLLCKVMNVNLFQSYLWEIVRSTLVTKHSHVVLWERESTTLQQHRRSFQNLCTKNMNNCSLFSSLFFPIKTLE